MFYRSVCCIFFASVIASVLTGCETNPTTAAKSVPAVQKPSPPMAEPRAPTAGEIARAKAARRLENIQQLLSEAEVALAADKLTTPVHDNAYDRFQAVLLLDDGNEQAKTGLLEIFSRYSEMSRDAIRRGDLGKARALIERAREVDRRSPELARIEEQFAARHKELREARKAEPPQPVNDKEILLDHHALRQRSDDLVEKLVNLAETVRETDESLLIFARSDEEGRWIYQQMAEAVIGYRVRGDIRLGKEAKILLLPPIE